jgi:trimethylamine--corrinoid protein Co-methyltransferase
MFFREPLRVLSADDMARIHDAALTILQDVGMLFDHPEARQLLRKAGATVDDATGVVKFPRRLVQASVDQMRRAYANPVRQPARMSARYSHVRFRTEPLAIHPDFSVNAGGFSVFIHDLEGRRRTATRHDVLCALNLVNQLDAITFTGLPVSDQAVPARLRPVAMAGLLAQHTAKFGGVETFEKSDIPYLIDIATVVKGSEDAVRAEPILVGYGETRSPLCFDRNMIDIFMEYIRRGFPQTVDTMPNAGATAPATAAGVLAMGAAETLGAVVLAHAIDPDAVVGVDMIPSTCDMQSGLFRYSSPERWTLLMARVQMISEFYGCPSGVHGGKTDSCHYDEQCGYDKGLTVMMPVLAGAVGIGTVGHLENAVTFSPVQLVIDAAFADGVRASLRGIEVNDETLGLDAIREVGIGGNFFGHDHTAAHFRETLFNHPLLQHQPWDSAQAGGDMLSRARARARELWQPAAPILRDDQHRAIEAILARATKRA